MAIFFRLFHIKIWVCALLTFIVNCFSAHCQDTLRMSLSDCVSYALENRQLVNQSKLDEQINERTIKANLAAWLPQVRMEYNLSHYFKLPVSLFPNQSNPNGPRQPIKIGVANTSNALFQADQTLFNNDVLLAAKASKYVKEQSKQQITSTEIDVIVEVSKSFYTVLLAQKQLEVIEEDIVRRRKLLSDTYNQFQSGLVDKIDYKRSSISLNNSESDRKRAKEQLIYRGTYLRQLMGMSDPRYLVLTYDTIAMRKESVSVDTNQIPDYNKRIEYQILNSQLQLLRLNVSYYRWGFLPNLSAFINYNFVYQNQEFQKLYSQNYPTSITGLRAVVPIFTGFRRIQNLQKAKLQQRRLELDQDYFKEQVQSEYQVSLGVYKANLYDFRIQEENLKSAREVYNITKFQYDQGIKTYLDVLTSEVELRTTEVNHLNALYNVLSSKLDLEKSLGNIR